MVNGPPGTRTSPAAGTAPARGAGGGGAVSTGSPGPQLVGGQHGLVVLLLVLGDHPEGEPALGQPAAVQRQCAPAGR